MSIRDELLEIKGDSELLQPETALDWARDNPESDLHRAITWDVEEAAQAHRLWEMRRLIAIHIVSVEGHRETISLSIDRKRQGGGYRMIDDVIPVVDLRECMLNDALADLSRLQAKYERLTELAQIWVEAERLRRERRRGRGRSRRDGEESRPTA
jgi:hypothetical protein